MVVGDIRQEAKIMLQGLRTTLVPIWFIFFVILGAAGGLFQLIIPIIGSAVTLIIGGPMHMGMTKIFLRIYHKEAIELGQMFEGFYDFTRTFTAYLLIAIYVFLWALLLIIPGIIAALGYSMTFYLMAENPALPAQEAMRKSKEMMMGHKSDLFRLGLSFIGWAFLCVFTFGIGFLWLESYMMASFTAFYYKIKLQQPEMESI